MIQPKPKHMQISEFTGTPEEFIAEITKVSANANGIAMVIKVGNDFHSYQYNMESHDLDFAAKVLRYFAKTNPETEH